MRRGKGGVLCERIKRGESYKRAYECETSWLIWIEINVISHHRRIILYEFNTCWLQRNYIVGTISLLSLELQTHKILRDVFDHLDFPNHWTLCDTNYLMEAMYIQSPSVWMNIYIYIICCRRSPNIGPIQKFDFFLEKEKKDFANLDSIVHYRFKLARRRCIFRTW